MMDILFLLIMAAAVAGICVSARGIREEAIEHERKK